MSNKDFENFYDNIYDGVSDDDMDLCPDCNFFVFPEEIINIKEHKIKCYNEKYDLYVNDKNKIIPSNRMELMGITRKGFNENNEKEAIILDFNEENFKKLYYRGKDLWENNLVDDYLIVFLQDEKCFNYFSPSAIQFARYFNLYNYLEYDEDLYTGDEKVYICEMTKKNILKKFNVEKTYQEIPCLDRGEELEM